MSDWPCSEPLLLAVAGSSTCLNVLIADPPGHKLVNLKGFNYLIPMPTLVYSVFIGGYSVLEFKLSRIGAIKQLPSSDPAPVASLPMPNIESHGGGVCYKPKSSYPCSSISYYSGVCSALDDWWSQAMNLDMLSSVVYSSPGAKILAYQRAPTNYQWLQDYFAAWEKLSIDDVMALPWVYERMSLTLAYGRYQFKDRPVRLEAGLNTLEGQMSLAGSPG